MEMYEVRATEPKHNIGHIWQGFTDVEAKNFALDLARANWRNIKVKKMVIRA